ncbi:MAG: YggS family pyridoxal phosphate-dependent enzyme [Bacteroidetes bacterium]|nr:YggS family pyridoxal phosphate-dependent enzyme [Bacteroidota bacterium]
MLVAVDAYKEISKFLLEQHTTLVAVSKTKPNDAVKELYDLGQRDFGENYVQELVDKQASLPLDIRWHFIGHLQSNKVKYIAPFVHLIHGVDSLKLLQEINKQALKNNRVIDCLLQVYIAQEETKFGLDETELAETIDAAANLSNINIKGLMGMASFSSDTQVLKNEFNHLQSLYQKYQVINTLSILSMGMSSDYTIAIESGSNLVRIGSLLFGARVYSK